VGQEATLLVDGNNGYREHPLATAEFAFATARDRVFAMEEMFDEELVAEAREVKRRLRVAGLATKLADGETYLGGIPTALLAERFAGSGGRGEPLYDIDQPDMNTAGYTRLLDVARICAQRGITVAPHNFGSKLGFYAQVHAGLVTPNWEFSETDDSAFRALQADGFRVERGRAELTGMPGLGVTLKEEHLEGPVFDLTV
jgi:L-alanine-DL-glutamate epimerase-like enolase superfamily enzyme